MILSQKYQQKVNELLNNEPVLIKVVKKRKTKHGDFRSWVRYRQSTKMRILLVFDYPLHEIAHHTLSKHGFRIAPHGREKMP